MGGVPQQAPATSRPQGPQQAQQAQLGPGSAPTWCSLGAPAGRPPAWRGGSREAAPRWGAAGGGAAPQDRVPPKGDGAPKAEAAPLGLGRPPGGEGP